MAKQDTQQGDQPEEIGLTSRIGLVEINWPKTVGYYGGIGLAVAAELIEPPFALFIAAIPVFKMLSHPIMPTPARVAGQVLEGAAQPVGGSDEATIHLVDANKQHATRHRNSILHEARALANRQRTARANSNNGRIALARTTHTAHNG